MWYKLDGSKWKENNNEQLSSEWFLRSCGVIWIDGTKEKPNFNCRGVTIINGTVNGPEVPGYKTTKIQTQNGPLTIVISHDTRKTVSW